MFWPKKSSGVDTDLTEQTLRDLFLPTAMVDNKVAAIDETWSGLRFVVRKENRGGMAPRLNQSVAQGNHLAVLKDDPVERLTDQVLDGAW